MYNLRGFGVHPKVKFRPKMFIGFPTEDVNEWLLQFERYSKFYSWSNQKRLNAISLLLGGSCTRLVLYFA